MKEFIDKLIERLEEEQKEAQSEGLLSFAMGFKSAKLIVNQLAEEYRQDLDKNSQGWIPVSERLPEESGRYISDNGIWQGECEFDIENKKFNACNVLAWMPLPAPFKEGE